MDFSRSAMSPSCLVPFIRGILLAENGRIAKVDLVSVVTVMIVFFAYNE